MPTYEFKCPKCGATTEEIRSFLERYNDPPKCPKCESSMEKLISGGAGFVLKGSGWAADGYASKKAGS